MKINKGYIIKNLRTERNLTQEEVGKIIGASKQTLHKYENGIITNIPQDKIEALANLFDVSPAYIMGWEEDKINLSNIPGVIPVKKIIKIPILGHIQCGSPVMSVENYEGYFPADPDIINSDFCLYADGDSMVDAGIHEGDLVFFKQTPQVENGTIAAVFVDDTTTLKRFYRKENQIILQPENKDYSPIIIDLDESTNIRILGEMVGMYVKGSK